MTLQNPNDRFGFNVDAVSMATPFNADAVSMADAVYMADAV